MRRFNGETCVFQCLLSLTKRLKSLQDFPFKPFHMLQCNVQEVSRAASWVKNAGRAKLPMKDMCGLDSSSRIAGVHLFSDGSQCIAPILTKRLDKRWNDKTFHIGTRSVVGSERMAFGRIERPL